MSVPWEVFRAVVLKLSFLLTKPFWFRIITTDPQIFARVNIGFQEVMYRKYKFISHN